MRVRREPAITFLGAAGSVTGSRFLVELGPHRVLVECGLYQEPEFEHRNREPFPVAPDEIDAVVLTHAHLDHCGYLPRLVSEGFRGPVWCTPATRDVAEIVWRDIARLEADRYARARRRRRDRPVSPEPPLYQSGDVDRVLRLVQTLEYDSPREILGGLTLTFRDAGHILGAATAHLRWEDGRERTRLLFSGDLGRPHRPIVRDPAAPLAADFVVVESTYGDRVHPRGDIESLLAEAVIDTARRGGALIIPAFAVQRAQEVLYALRRLSEAQRIPALPVYLDSPMAQTVTALFRQYRHLLDADVAGAYRGRRSPFTSEALRVTASVEESQAIWTAPHPLIVVAGSGMCEGGRVVHHLARYLDDAASTVLFVGYQAPGTLGSRIVAGPDRVQVAGRTVEVRADIRAIHEFSAHADRDELVAWLRRLPDPPRHVFAVHGTPESADGFAGHLHRQTGWSTSAPSFGDRVPLITHGAPGA
jgi:metallo-beta-lactamase family protein